MLNLARLHELLGYLYDMKGIQCSLHERNGREIYSSKARSAFCDLICASPEGYRRCLGSDKAAIRKAIAQKMPFQYRCHAGVIDSAIPVLVGGEAAVVILFGQILDDSPVDQQWEAARPEVSWYPDQEALRHAFYSLPRMGSREITACYELVNACVSETKMEQLSAVSASENAQKLELYITNNYAQALTVKTIAAALNLSVSRVCALAAGIAPGMTVIKMLTRQRVEAAKTLLASRDLSIQEVAGRVGIPDYNYFTKVFKKESGLTPSQWRRQQHTQKDL